MNDMIPVADLEKMAAAFAKSKLFGAKTPEEALSLMLVAQAEGLHPASAARDYDIIQGKGSKKSEAMLRDFIKAGGKVEWHALDNTKADATFSHSAGGSIRIDWDMARAKAAQLDGKEMYKKYPRQMLRARCISEGVRTVCPLATGGMYSPEEVADLEPKNMGDAEIVRLDEKQETDFASSFDAAENNEALKTAWQPAVEACNAISDKEAYDRLKAKMLARYEALEKKVA